MSESHWWYLFHKDVKSSSSTTWFRIRQFQNLAKNAVSSNASPGWTVRFLGSWSEFSERVSQGLSNGTKVASQLANFFSVFTSIVDGRYGVWSHTRLLKHRCRADGGPFCLPTKRRVTCGLANLTCGRSGPSRPRDPFNNLNRTRNIWAGLVLGQEKNKATLVDGNWQRALNVVHFVLSCCGQGESTILLFE
jgi:hypothetical protein